MMKLNFIENKITDAERIFLRADLNVPLLKVPPSRNQDTFDDFKLQSILPTIEFLQKEAPRSKIILATHIGRPDAKGQKNFFDENFSTKMFVDWFEKRGFSVDYEIDLKKAIEKSKIDDGKILLLENLRFYNGEKETNNSFAEFLAQLADVYINDAFGILHRNDTSITLLPQQFEPKNRFLGPLFKKEILSLTKLKENPEQPFIAILGGNKLETKLPLIKHFCEQPEKNRVTKILFGGTLAQHLNNLDECGIKIILPVDDTSCDIGPETITLFEKEIAGAKTIFLNGTMGIYENKDCATGTKKILEAIYNENAYTVIGGGDAVAAANMFLPDNSKNIFLSTGGGAALAFLTSKNPEEDFETLQPYLK